MSARFFITATFGFNSSSFAQATAIALCFRTTAAVYRLPRRYLPGSAGQDVSRSWRYSDAKMLAVYRATF
jgi:hypothetical protein